MTKNNPLIFDGDIIKIGKANDINDYQTLEVVSANFSPKRQVYNVYKVQKPWSLEVSSTV